MRQYERSTPKRIRVPSALSVCRPHESIQPTRSASSIFLTSSRPYNIAVRQAALIALAFNLHSWRESGIVWFVGISRTRPACLASAYFFGSVPAMNQKTDGVCHAAPNTPKSRTIRKYPRSRTTMRWRGRCARRCPITSARRNVPRNDQHCPRRAAEHTFSDGTLSETLPAPPPVGTKDDEVGLLRIGMQHDRSSWIAVLLDGPNRNALALCALPQAGQKFEAFALVPRKRIVGGHRVKDVEAGLAHTGNAERPIEGVTACFREIDCTQDLLDRCHRYLPTDQPRRAFRFLTPFGRGDVTPSVHGGASLAGNESARI
jgi:hypothetical protein